jgi:hypothetical protein
MILTFTLCLATADADTVIIDGMVQSKASAFRRACEILQAVSPDLKISATLADFRSPTLAPSDCSRLPDQL